MYKFFALIFTLAVFTGCSGTTDESTKGEVSLIDEQANAETVALYKNLHQLGKEQTMFGHQATLDYGYSWAGEENRSDVKDVTGSFPAVYGWDFSGFEDYAKDEEQYLQNKRQHIEWVKQAYERGGVNTYAWHQTNPVTRENFYDTTRAVHTMIPGGENHEYYKTVLDTLASFFHDVDPIPIIFRPYHEHNGDWFWWGKGLASEEDYIALWQFTVDYLMKEKEVHNAIYAFSPDRSRMDLDEGEEAYYYAYPGDDYVDIIGLDNYWDVGHPANDASAEEDSVNFIRSLELATSIADKKNKVAALTETGIEAIPDSTWWTDVMMEGINATEQSRKIAYLQVWRNANFEREQRDHYYAPYPGQISAENFVEFYEHESILFEDELPDLYSWEEE